MLPINPLPCSAPRSSRYRRRSVQRFALAAFAIALVTTLATPAAAETPRTARLDYFHTGSATSEVFSFDRLVVEPLPWPGNPDRPIDDTNLGKYLFEIRDAESDDLLYSRGFASIYGEWETTGEAKQRHRTFHESLRFPLPEAPFEVTLLKRDPKNEFVEAWKIDVDPADILTDTAPPPAQELITIQNTGPSSHKVDVLLLGDGYTDEECSTFLEQAQRMTEFLFAHSPFKERRNDFNVWALCPPAEESGISRPSTGIHRRSPARSTYDAFRSERYLLTFDNRAWREVAAWAPYEFVEILANSETYGGGGIFGLYSTVAAGSDWADYVFLHEFGHHFAGLADEYYTSPVAYEIPEDQVEPWEVNATVTLDPLKWADQVDAGVPVPTPWPKEAFETHAKEIQKRRQQIRAENRPESEMSELFREQREYETKLLGSTEFFGRVGAYEGANYAPRGTWRPQVDCVMFSRNEVPFCGVCQSGIEMVIDLYVEGGVAD